MGTTGDSQRKLEEAAARALKVPVARVREDRRRVAQRIAESAGISAGQALRRHGKAYSIRLKTIVVLIRKGYPPEVGAMLPVYWTVRRPEGWYVLGGAYGAECDPGKLDVCESLAEAKSEAALYARLDLAAVQALNPAQFTAKVRAELRRLDGETA